MTDGIITASDETFSTLIATANGRPILIDFWAEWCGPCKALSPVLDDLSVDYAGEMTIAKLDIMANEATAKAANVKNIPLLVIYRDGVEIARQVGSTTKSRLAAFIEEHLA